MKNVERIEQEPQMHILNVNEQQRDSNAEPQMLRTKSLLDKKISSTEKPERHLKLNPKNNRSVHRLLRVSVGGWRITQKTGLQTIAQNTIFSRTENLSLRTQGIFFMCGISSFCQIETKPVPRICCLFL